MARIVPGALHAQNRRALDWGYNGLVAYGCQNDVVVLCPREAVVLKTLTGHKAAVSLLKWCCRGRSLIASADICGRIIVWNVRDGEQLSSFRLLHNPIVTDLSWLEWQEPAEELLLVVHPPSTLVLWNAATGDRVWTKTYSELSLASLALDPFHTTRCALLTQSGNLMLVDDISSTKAPSSNGGQVFRISNTSSSTTSSGSPAATPTNEQSGSRSAQTVLSDGARRIGKPFLQAFRSATADRPSPTASGASKQSSDESGRGGTCIELVYHRGARDILILVYPREVLLLNTASLQTVAQVVVDRTMAAFLRVLPSWQRDALYLVQEHGCVSLRCRQFRTSSGQVSLPTDDFSEYAADVYSSCEMVYEPVCVSESVRVTKNYRLFAAVLDPVSQTSLLLLMSTGRAFVYTVRPSTSHLEVPLLASMLKMNSTTLRITPIDRLKFSITGQVSNLGNNPCLVRHRPPSAKRLIAADGTVNASADGDQDRNEEDERDLIAVATKDGYVQLIEANGCQVVKDFAVHSCPIKCMEWGGRFRLVTAAYSQTLSTNAVVRNEVVATDIRTGLTKVIRPESDESPIELIRVSFYHSYVAMSFRSQPMEIWDLNQARLLRRMSRRCPVVLDMAWSGKHHTARAVDGGGGGGVSTETTPLTATDSHDQQRKNRQLIYRENLVVLDNENHMFHVVVKGMHVKDGREVNTQWTTTSQINAMVWKDDYLAFGDNDGKLSIWDLAAKHSKASALQRGAVKRLQFSREPKDYTLVVLHTDGVSLWDASKVTPLWNVLVPTDVPGGVVDVDVNGSTTALLTVGGSLIVAGVKHPSLDNLPVSNRLLNRVFQPSLLDDRSSALLHLCLSDQRVINVELMRSDETDEPTSVLDEVTLVVRQLADRRNRTDQQPHLLALLAQLQCCPGVAYLVSHEESKTMSALARRLRRLVGTATLLGDELAAHCWTVLAAAFCDQHSVFLQPHLDIMWNQSVFKALWMQRLSLFDASRASAEQLREHTEALISVSLFEPAVQLLLAAPAPATADKLADALKACLLSASHSAPSCQSTIKLIATNLIANGNVSEGVQLLCLIGRLSDACRYLQSNGDWAKAAAVAKVGLNAEEQQLVISKWAAQLATTGFKSKALLLEASVGRWERVVEILIGLRRPSLAVLLIETVEMMQKEDVHDESGDTVDAVSLELREAAYAEYARELSDVGLFATALYYCGFAGVRGDAIRREIDILHEE